MKIIATALLTISLTAVAMAQSGYPTPKKTASRLFYIQHSNNHNTYVYDVNSYKGKIDPTEPVVEYQIAYAESGEKKPLTAIQRKMAYGMSVVAAEPNLIELKIAATEKFHFYLYTTPKKTHHVYVQLQNRKVRLDHLFIQLKESGLTLKPDLAYIIFYGNDLKTGKEVKEKVLLD